MKDLKRIEYIFIPIKYDDSPDFYLHTYKPITNADDESIVLDLAIDKKNGTKRWAAIGFKKTYWNFDMIKESLQLKDNKASISVHDAASIIFKKTESE